jgi:OmpA-OmpF porin, OOP family
MKKAFILSLAITLISLHTFSQTQPATFGIHFIYQDFQTASSIRTTSLSTTLRDKKFGRINNMSPGLALNYIHGLSPKIRLHHPTSRFIS